ncbi:MAG: polysaccharide deacetylase family protein, partial [Bacilli bacterium]
MKKIKIKSFLILFIIIIGLIFFVYFVNKKDNKLINKPEEEEVLKKDFLNMNIVEVEEYAKKHDLEITKTYEFNENIEKDVVISSSLNNKNLDLVISKGSIPLATYKEKNVNELGKVPIMMYHGIREKTSNSSGTIGGNVDKDGYNRTPEAFEADLEFYYQNGYRMISLADYVKGIVDVPLGFSPLILTFDDGNADNFKVIGKNEDGSLQFDSKSAIGILEKMKEKYPDFNVTATFFLNAGLCNQPKYNEDIMKWLIKNNYDIGNHTTNHADFTKTTVTKTQEVVGKLYKMLDQIIPNQYVK